MLFTLSKIVILYIVDYKADESYQIGPDDQPLKPYLRILKKSSKLQKENEVDAIHPGYGFLSENVTFARRCREEGIIFVGPQPEVMEQLGDKIAAKELARFLSKVRYQHINSSINTSLLLECIDRVLLVILLYSNGYSGDLKKLVVDVECVLNQQKKFYLLSLKASNEALKQLLEMELVHIERIHRKSKHIKKYNY